MSPEQRGRFLPDFLADDLYHLSIAQHEPDADLGWDYFQPPVAGSGVRTTAVRTSNGDWVINGSKNFITNGSIAKLICVEARTVERPGERGRVRTFLVPADTPGLTRREQNKLGQRLGSNAMLFFDDCRVPAENLIANEGARPDQDRIAEVGRGPVYIQAWGLGIGQAALEAALEYAKLRVQGGKRIVERQAVGLALADMAISLHAGRAMLWQAAWALDHRDAYDDGSLPDLPLAAMARVQVSESVKRTTVAALELFGGSGLMNELPVQKYLRDAMSVQHGVFGTNDTARLRVAEILAGHRRGAVTTPAPVAQS